MNQCEMIVKRRKGTCYENLVLDPQLKNLRIEK